MPDAGSLTARERRLVTLSAVTAGPALEDLDGHVADALASGDLTIEELLELALHFAVYGGWPRASHLELAVTTQWARMHNERGEPIPPFPTLDADTRTGADRRAAGLEKFEEVNRFGAPPVDTPLRLSVVEWVFGDLWLRPGLARRDRRLVSVTTVAMGASPFPLSVHTTSALHSGDLTTHDAHELADVVATHGGEDRAAPLRAVIDEAWSTRPA
jgi:4-carboxymuconolactone decarboxylase